MNNDIDYQKIFAWAIELTAQTDYQALTHGFLNYLEQFPFVTQATAYEIYGDRRLRTGQASNGAEHLVRRFPLNISAEAPEENLDLLMEINTTLDFKASSLNPAGLYTKVLASVSNVTGPDRAILLYGQFDNPALDIINSSISLYRNQVSLHDNKERDPLTKLPNRQSFDARIMQVCEHFRNRPIIDKQLNKCSWIAMLDIDHFKRVNDGFGHLIGDEVLLIFSQLMKKYFRFNDFLFRFGGEEFVVILNLVNQADAIATFERFRVLIAEHTFPSVDQITVSIGIAHITNAVIPTTLLDRADRALYYAKEHGRNKLVFYDDIEAEFTETDYANHDNTELF